MWLSEIFASFATRQPQRDAIVTASARLSWSQLHSSSLRYAELFTERGVQAHDTVAVATDDATSFLPALAAASRCRAKFVPVSTRLSADAMQALLDHCKPTILIQDDGVARSDGRSWASADVQLRTEEAAELAASRSGREAGIVTGTSRSTDPFVLLYTSGTTSLPKAVERDVAGCAAWWSMLAQHNGMSPTTVTAVASPLYTGMSVGCVLPTLVAGGTCVFSASDFIAEEFLELSQRVAPTFCSFSPTHWTLLAAESKFSAHAFRSFKRMVSGGARLDEGLKRKLLELFPSSFVELYGTSESGAISELSARMAAAKRGSVGTAWQDVKIRIVDKQGRSVDGAEGDVVVRTSRLMTGYYNNPEATSRAWWIDPRTNERFVRTGDVGRVDESGYLWLAGRGDDVIISGGYNIHPSDIERIVLAHDDVLEAAVVGRPDDVLGQTPVAFTVLRRDAQATASRVCQWVNQRASKNQQLYAVYVLDAIPKNAAGKPLLRELRTFV